MIDYDVDDIVIGIAKAHHEIYGKLFRVTAMRSGSMVNIIDEKTGEEQKGWYTHRFKKYNEGDEKTCGFCTSQCKREEPCQFHIPIWSVIR